MSPVSRAGRGMFVSRRDGVDGIGRLISVENNLADVEYFVCPASESSEKCRVPMGELQTLELETHTRVHYYDKDDLIWRVGRIAEGGEVAPEAIGAREPHYAVQFPNQDLRRIPRSELRVRWERPVTSPIEYLAARVNETAFWQEGRTELVRAIIRQRAAFRGLTGLASASIVLHEHQFNIVRTILHDPVQRYLLADEVGLGKTIEAGAILRQFLLDEPDSSRAVVVVPPHLIDQWEAELETKFFIGVGPQARISLVSSEAPAQIKAAGEGARMLIVDEAHLPAKHAHSANSLERAPYDAIRDIAAESPRVLLLSATPVLTNEDGFLAMLHLLDPSGYPLEAREAFRLKIRARQDLADAVHDLHDDVDPLFLEERLDALVRLLVDDQTTQELCRRLRPFVEEEDDPERARLVEELRSHISETYRLDRRMLRTRRETESIAPDLPRRTGLEIRHHDDPLRRYAEEFIERWRDLAVGCEARIDRSTAATLLRILVGASCSHPRLLRTVIEARESRCGDELQETGFDRDDVETIVNPPHLEGEVSLLRNFALLLANDEEDPRVDILASTIQTEMEKGFKAIVFVDQPTVAESVWGALTERNVKCELRQDFGAVEKFLSDQDCAALVCDRRAEEGMNLQGAKAVVVHYDLPLSPQRIEQRLGRLDRIGGKHNKVRSFTFSSGTTYEDAWIRCLAEGFGVFRRSIAPLQYVLEERLGDALPRLLDEGSEVFDSLREICSSPDGLEKELKGIRSQEALDSVDSREERSAAFEAALELDDEHEELRTAVRTWLAKGLQFCEEEGPEGGTRYRPTSRTLMPTHQFRNLFPRSLRWDPSAGGSRYSTPWMTYDRDEACRKSIFLARVGNPLIDEIERAIQLDDRGVAYAFWRLIPDLEQHGPELFFRFDFVIEADLELLIHAVNDQPQPASRSALRRRADEAFPPIHRVVWLDGDFDVVAADVLPVLQDPYEHSPAADGRRDFNIGGRWWPRIDQELGIPDWLALCHAAHEAALRRLRTDTGLEALCRERAADIEAERRRISAQFRSRLSRPDAIGRAADEASFRLEKAIGYGLAQATRLPQVRLDTVGAIVLSNRLPEREDG